MLCALPCVTCGHRCEIARQNAPELRTRAAWCLVGAPSECRHFRKKFKAPQLLQGSSRTVTGLPPPLVLCCCMFARATCLAGNNKSCHN